MNFVFALSLIPMHVAQVEHLKLPNGFYALLQEYFHPILLWEDYSERYKS